MNGSVYNNQWILDEAKDTSEARPLMRHPQLFMSMGGSGMQAKRRLKN